MKELYSYYYKKRYGFVNEKRLFERIKWGNHIVLNNQGYSINHFESEEIDKLMDCTQTEYNFESEIFQSKIDDELIFVINNEKKWCKQYGIELDYVINLDNSKRYLLSENSIYENKSLTIIDICYRKNKQILSVDSYSTPITNIKGFEAFVVNKRESILERLSMTLLKGIPKFKNVYLSELSSAVLTHEIFGHLFEIDNYKFIKDSKTILEIPEFIDIVDNPCIEQSGFCKFNDEGNLVQPLQIIKNGKIENLISTNEYLADMKSFNTRGRLGKNGKLILPRVTNTVLVSSSSNKCKTIDDLQLEALLYVDSINFAKLSKDIVTFQVASGELYDGKHKFSVSALTLSFHVKEIINNIIYLNGENRYFSSAQGCIKKGQAYLGIGYAAPKMVVKLDYSKAL